MIPCMTNVERRLSELLGQETEFFEHVARIDPESGSGQVRTHHDTTSRDAFTSALTLGAAVEACALLRYYANTVDLANSYTWSMSALPGLVRSRGGRDSQPSPRVTLSCSSSLSIWTRMRLRDRGCVSKGRSTFHARSRQRGLLAATAMYSGRTWSTWCGPSTTPTCARQS